MFSGDDTPVEELKNSCRPTTSKNKMDLINNKIMWEYKWDEGEDSQIYGPYSSEDMLAWNKQGYFRNGVYVRKVNEKSFYSSKRIDFDLYI